MTKIEKVGLVMFIMGIVFLTITEISDEIRFFLIAYCAVGMLLFLGSGKTTK